jgi:hypothetical protein
MKFQSGFLSCVIGTLALAGCMSSSNPNRNAAVPQPAAASTPALAQLQEKQFVFAVLEYLYRWHFDQSFVLDAGKSNALEIWVRELRPPLDDGDHSEYAEMWIPAVNMRVELKRSDYTIPEMNLAVVDRSFKVKRVTRQLKPPAVFSDYQVSRYAFSEVQDHLFDSRTNRARMNENLRAAARTLVMEYLLKTHPAPFTEDQILYVAPPSTVCNDLWAFWETDRKLMLFAADMDLSNPGFEQLSQLRLEVIDLDKDVVASTKEVPGSNAFVTKDWVGRMFFNCILYGERIVRTPEEMNQLRAAPAGVPAR